MKVIELLEWSSRLVDEVIEHSDWCDDRDDVIELRGHLAEYLAAVRGEWNTFDEPDPELVEEVESLFGVKS